MFVPVSNQDLVYQRHIPWSFFVLSELLREVMFVLLIISSLGTPVSSTNETDRHDIAEILLKVTLNIKTLALFGILFHFVLC
jgi:hypothetical protein